MGHTNKKKQQNKLNKARNKQNKPVSKTYVKTIHENNSFHLVVVCKISHRSAANQLKHCVPQEAE